MERRARRTDSSLNRIKREAFCDRKDRPAARTRKAYSTIFLPASSISGHPSIPRPPPRKVRDAMRRGDVVVHYSRPICDRPRGCARARTSPSIKVSRSLNEEGGVKDNVEIGNPSITS